MKLSHIDGIISWGGKEVVFAGRPGKTLKVPKVRSLGHSRLVLTWGRMDYADLVSSLLLSQPVTGLLLNLFSACSLLFCPH